MHNFKNDKIPLDEKNDFIDGHPQTSIEIKDCEDEVSQGMLTDKTKLIGQLEVLETLNDCKHQWTLQGKSLHLEAQHDIIIEMLTQEMDGVVDDIKHLMNECDEIEGEVDAMRQEIG